MAASSPYHNCDHCKPIVEQIISSYLRDVHDGMSHPEPLDLGSLNHILGLSAACDFYNFILRLHDQVRPSFALAPARGMPECAARNHRTSRVHAILDVEETLDTQSGKQQAWSNHIDFIHRVDGLEIPVETKWKAMFRLVADDIHLLQLDDGRHPVDLGRLLDPLAACDPLFWQKSFRTCLEQHKDSCQVSVVRSKSSSLPRSMRVLDLVDQMICPLPPKSDYAVMSYVWGITNTFRLTTANYDQLTTKDSLLDAEKPKSIYDAIIVAQALDIRYLWIDALCIIQDDDQDKMDQVHRMGQIYTNAILTIVGARAGHANGGLWSSEHRSQIIGQGGGLRWLSAAPMLPDAVNLSAWAKRAWTYQEGAFSRRALVFTEHQAYFTCKCSAWAEDYVRRIRNGRHELEYHRHKDQGRPSGTIERLLTYPISWSYLLRSYTNRRLTFESDVLIASAGVVASYLHSHDDVALCGLPISMLFEYGLLWMPVAPLSRRTKSPPGQELMFPSWSWAGWSGPVGYDRSDHAVRPHVDHARLIRGWRFLCDDLKNPLTSSQLLHEHDHYLDNVENHTSRLVSLQTVQQGTLIFSALEVRLRVDAVHWNQFMESEDEKCEHTGYYKLYNEQQWIGSAHLEHTVARQINEEAHRQEILALSTTGGQGPTMLTPLPHIGEPDEHADWQPLCDPTLLEKGDTEMYNVMLVTKKTHYGKGRYRTGVGQVHKKSFDEMEYHRRDIWLE